MLFRILKYKMEVYKLKGRKKYEKIIQKNDSAYINSSIINIAATVRAGTGGWYVIQ